MGLRVPPSPATATAAHLSPWSLLWFEGRVPWLQNFDTHGPGSRGQRFLSAPRFQASLGRPWPLLSTRWQQPACCRRPQALWASTRHSGKDLGEGTRRPTVAGPRIRTQVEVTLCRRLPDTEPPGASVAVNIPRVPAQPPAKRLLPLLATWETATQLSLASFLNPGGSRGTGSSSLGSLRSIWAARSVVAELMKHKGDLRQGLFPRFRGFPFNFSTHSRGGANRPAKSKFRIDTRATPFVHPPPPPR